MFGARQVWEQCVRLNWLLWACEALGAFSTLMSRVKLRGMMRWLYFMRRMIWAMQVLLRHLSTFVMPARRRFLRALFRRRIVIVSLARPWLSLFLNAHIHVFCVMRFDRGYQNRPLLLFKHLCVHTNLI